MSPRRQGRGVLLNPELSTWDDYSTIESYLTTNASPQSRFKREVGRTFGRLVLT